MTTAKCQCCGFDHDDEDEMTLCDCCEHMVCPECIDTGHLIDDDGELTGDTVEQCHDCTAKYNEEHPEEAKE